MISVLVPLFEQATKVNTMCAMSGPCETSLRVAAYIHRIKRIRLSSDSLRDQLILKQFVWLIRKLFTIKKVLIFHTKIIPPLYVRVS